MGNSALQTAISGKPELFSLVTSSSITRIEYYNQYSKSEPRVRTDFADSTRGVYLLIEAGRGSISLATQIFFYMSLIEA